MKTFLVIVFLFSVDHLMAQFCPGSLGDPVLNETFGTAAHQYNLPPNTTTYAQTRGCPNKGQYTINNFIFGCGAGTWQQTIGDHTGDVDGNYMMIDAEGTPGTVYTTTVNNLCPNTTYQLGVWVMNVLKITACNGNPVHPNLLITVSDPSGIVLASTTTGDIPETDMKTWKQFGVCVTTGANLTSLVVKITTNPKPGCGSAFMIDDITLKASGASVNITLDNSTADKDVCSGYSDPFIFKGTYSASFTDPVVQWQNSADSGKTWTDIANATSLIYAMPKRNSGLIKYRMLVAERNNIKSASCRIASLPIAVNVHLLPNQQANVTKIGCSDQPYQLVDTSFSSSYNLKYDWRGPNNFKSNLVAPTIPVLAFSDSGQYIVTLTTDFGCSQTDTLTLKVLTGSQISISPAIANICSGQKVNYVSNAPGDYSWQPAKYLSSTSIGDPVSTPLDSVSYVVTLTNPSGCKSFTQVSINVLKSPVANGGPDQTILKGDSVMLVGSVSGTGINYFWTPDQNISDNKSVTPIVNPPVTTTYTLTAESTVGCGSSHSDVLVKVFKDIYVPNAFTPNNDGRNDVLQISAPTNFTMKLFGIYNRNGQLIYKTTTSDVKWDGTFKGQPQPAGIYVYSIIMEAPGNRKISRKGSFLLIR